MKDTHLAIIGIIAIVIGFLAIGVAGKTMQDLNELEAQVEANKANAISALQKPSATFDDTEIYEVLDFLNTELKDQKSEYTREIVAVKKDLQNAQIGTGDAQKDKLNEQTGTGTTPNLTITLVSGEYIKGEIIWFSGKANPGQPIEATVCLPVINDFEICGKRTLNATVDQRGNYNIGFATDFDDPVGIYNVYVRSEGETSEQLSFLLK